MPMSHSSSKMKTASPQSPTVGKPMCQNLSALPDYQNRSALSVSLSGATRNASCAKNTCRKHQHSPSSPSESRKNERIRRNVLNKEDVAATVESNEGYRVLKSIQGSPPFWELQQKELLVTVRQLDCPAFLFTLPAVETKWLELGGIPWSYDGACT
ncbi:hypothetical protein BaRGS_00015295 [Batillaria attramentaria]|uniref:Uncharacterized protein n=1 Tax=Batillaria attramentaria TaxID=370345 RepID=A0ABD0L255_9CAEN